MLGHRIRPGCIGPDPEKVTAIARLLPPRNIRELSAFLGLVGFYRKFIPQFAKKARALFSLLKKETTWEWQPPQEHSFQELKGALSNDSWLASPSQLGRFRLYTDFSAIAFGAALHQIQNGTKLPVTFASRLCRGAETSLDSPTGELAAVIFALTKFREYLGYGEFDLITDSTTVKALQSQGKLSGKLARWAILLSQFRFQVHHRAGTKLGNADGLSRSHQADGDADKGMAVQQVWYVGKVGGGLESIQEAEEDMPHESSSTELRSA